MARWIAHLRLAEGLLEEIPGLDAAYFAIGNIAPDSGVRDSNGYEFNPPTRVSHFLAPEGSAYRSADLDFYREYLEPIPEHERTSDVFSFLLGYFFHLVTDNLWYADIDEPTREEFKAEFDKDPEFIWEVKRDWYGLDLAHVRKNPDSIYWKTFLDADYDKEFLPFLSQQGIQKRVEEIKQLYQRTDDEIEEWYGHRPDKYLSEKAYDSFVVRSIRRLLVIYEVLFEERRTTVGESSVLELGV